MKLKNLIDRLVNDGGAVFFGIVIGWITAITFYSQTAHAINDLSAIIAIIGGSLISNIFSKTKTQFSMYCIGMFFGFLIQVLYIAHYHNTWPIMNLK